MGRPIAITGLGTVTAVSADVAELGRAIVDGRCGIRPLTRFETKGRSRLAAEAVVPGMVAGVLAAADVRRLSHADRLALAAADQACTQAGLDPATRRATALISGATTADMFAAEDAYRVRRAGESSRFRASQLRGAALNVPAAVVAQALGLFGPRSTVSTACSSSALAIGMAVDLIRRGAVPTALALGCDQLCRLTFAGFDALQALDVDPCRPFDRGRRGLSLGEGAAALVLEDPAHARARGATILGWVLGWGTSTDAHHVTAPHPEGVGAVAALRGALADAERPATVVEYVNAHGSGTKHNDETEVGALRAVIGERLAQVPISSTKSQLGHTLAAAGAIEAVTTMVALQRGVLPPTIHLGEAEWTDLDFVSTPGRTARIGVAASSSYGFGGHNVTVLLAHAEAA